MDGLGAIKEGTELEDYDSKYSFIKALGYTGLGVTTGTLLLGGIAYAGYMKYKSTPKTKQVKNA